eukprot:2675010-Rhodomonas_salina.2
MKAVAVGCSGGAVESGRRVGTAHAAVARGDAEDGSSARQARSRRRTPGCLRLDDEGGACWLRRCGIDVAFLDVTTLHSEQRPRGQLTRCGGARGAGGRRWTRKSCERTGRVQTRVASLLGGACTREGMRRHLRRRAHHHHRPSSEKKGSSVSGARRRAVALPGVTPQWQERIGRKEEEQREESGGEEVEVREEVKGLKSWRVAGEGEEKARDTGLVPSGRVVNTRQSPPT